MKKVLLLGGAILQVPSILTAKRMGCYTIVCDLAINNPGRRYADEFYNISTTDKDAVLKLAQELEIDGIVCYVSDPSAPTAAYVAEQMGLATSPYKSVEILANKDKFRTFLAENGFNTPKAKGFAIEELDNALEEAKKFKFPLMVKPVDSSGSRGVKRINEIGELKSAIDGAMIYSRSKRFILEEYIEKYGYQIAGDGFSVDGELVFRCFANEHFDVENLNPYYPIGESWPYIMSERVHTKIHNEIQRLLRLLDMKTQAYNFDIRIDEDENVYLMEIGPRNGGNMIPQVTKYATGVDMVEYTIRAALGESCDDIKMVEPVGCWSCYVVHCQNSGILKEVWIDEELRTKNLVECNMLYEEGDSIEVMPGAMCLLGVMILRYETKEEMLDKMEHMKKWVKVIIE